MSNNVHKQLINWNDIWTLIESCIYLRWDQKNERKTLTIKCCNMVLQIGNSIYSFLQWNLIYNNHIIGMLANAFKSSQNADDIKRMIIELYKAIIDEILLKKKGKHRHRYFYLNNWFVSKRKTNISQEVKYFFLDGSNSSLLS
jgi:hypothetical protein